MSKIKTEYIKFDKINSLGSYVNLNNKQVIEAVEQFKQNMHEPFKGLDLVDGNTIRINPHTFDDVDRYNKIKKLLPIQSDMWDWFTNFRGEDVYIEINYTDKVVNVVNIPEADHIHVNYIISRHPIDDVNEIENIDVGIVTFNVDINQSKNMIAYLERVGDIPVNKFLLRSSENISDVGVEQTVALEAGLNKITFKGLTTGKYHFVLKNMNGKVEYDKNLTYLDGHENYNNVIEIYDYVVSGRILDSQTNQPVSNAIVDIFSNGDIWKSETIVTSDDGYYSVNIDGDTVEQGITEFTIRVSADNYVGQLETVDVIIGTYNINQDILLLEGDPTPKVLSITWIDEAESVYTGNLNTYKQDKEALEKYIYKYGLIQFDPNYGSNWSGRDNAYKALIHESVGMPSNIEYEYLQNRAQSNNWNELFSTYKNVFSKLIQNYPTAQNVKVGLFIDNSGSLSSYQVFLGLSSSNVTCTRDSVDSVSNVYLKEYCQWIFDTYPCVTNISLKCAGNEQWIKWTIDYINQMES